MTMTQTPVEIGPSKRVLDYTAAYRKFLSEDVAKVETALEKLKVGTAAQPDKDEHGRMHPAVWEARREVQRLAGAKNLYAPHIQAGLGGQGFNRVEMHHVEEFVYRESGLGLGLAG